MKNTILTAMAFAALTMSACKQAETAPEPEAPAADAAQIKSEIQAMETSFAENMNAGNPDSVVYYSDDATSYGQDKAPNTGRQAILKDMHNEIAKAPKGAKVAYTTNEVFPSPDGDQVVELGSYKLSDSTGTALASGNFMALFEKKDGKYWCVRDMSASDQTKK